MTLRAGHQLGPYTIEDTLGVGGMGEVYRAHDPRLRRSVPLKIWITNLDPPRSAKEISTRTGLEGGYGLAWSPDGRIVFVSMRSGRRRLWIMNADGSGQRLLADQGPGPRNPVVTPDGKSVVFGGSDESGDRIWRMDLDGGSAAPITAGPFDVDPVVSHDGRWVYYFSQHPDRPGMHKVPFTGGGPSYVDRGSPPDAASDGRVLVFVDESGGTAELAHGLVSSFQRVEGVPSLYHPLNRLRAVSVRLTDGGRALLYGATRSGVSNVWRRRLSGGTPEQITDFATTASSPSRSRTMSVDWRSHEGRSRATSC